MSFLNPLNKSYSLEKICESNYAKLLKLLPDLLLLKHESVGYSVNNVGLQINLLGVSPYTLTLELNHRFNFTINQYTAPAIQVRLYLDMCLAEVLNDHDRVQVHKIFKDQSQSTDIMHYKWQLNYFLQKWLDHCLYKAQDITKVA